MTPRERGRALALVLLVVLTYLPVRGAGYVWDDDVHVTANPALDDLHGLAAAWTTLDATPQYYPLTHTTFWIERRVWGLHPLGYHVDNVLLHAVSAILVWRLLLLLEVPGAFLAAAVFAVHPVHVESVAWITERKNTLSGALYLGAALSFLGAALAGGRRRFLPWPSALLFAGALLAKTVTASLPLALAIVLGWKRGRVERREVAWLAPMLAAGALAGALTRYLETTQISASGADWALAFPDRLVLAGRIFWFYLGKLVWPAHLVFVYPRFGVDASRPASWVPLAAAVVLAAALLALRRRIGRGPIAALAFFAVTLAPASGFFNVYPMRYSWVADHFQYLASLGPIALACALATLAVRRLAAARPAAALAGKLAAIAAIVALAAVASGRTLAYASAEVLWRDTIARNPGAFIAHNDLGILLAQRGATAAAEAEFRKTLALKPDHAGAQANLGYALEIEGRPDEAAEALARAVALAPEDADARAHLVRCLLRAGRTDAALPHALALARLRPTDPEAACDAGALLARAGRYEEGIALLERALALRPGFPRARANLEIARRGAEGSRSNPGDGLSSRPFRPATTPEDPR